MDKLDLKSIWQVPIYLPYLQPKLTDDLIQDAEAKIGYKFPRKYIELLKIQNGGYIRFGLRNMPHTMISGIGPHYPSITDFEWLAAYNDYLSFELDGLFPFDGDGHWNICLDYRKNRLEPEITYIDTESDVEELISPTFKDYLNLLQLDTENEYVIETTYSIETVTIEISRITGISFQDPDDRAHGYPVYRGKFDESWVWISPNKVSKGFIRISDERYDELKSQMEGYALRFPEISESSLFINISDDLQRQKLLAKLTENGFAIRELRKIII